MVSRSGGAHEFWVVCGGQEDPAAPLDIRLADLDDTLPVFSFEEEALLYLGLRDGDGLRAERLTADRLLMLLLSRWSDFDSVALDPIPELDADLAFPLTAMSRWRFARFLASRQDAGVCVAAAAL